MIKSISYILFWASLMLFCCQILYAQKDERQIRGVFEKYKNAIDKNQGKKAIQLVDSTTLQYYQKILEIVINEDTTTFQKFSFLEKQIFQTLIFSLNPNDIKNMNGADLFIHAVNNGMVSKRGLDNIKVGEIIILDNHAKGKLASWNGSIPAYLLFNKENNQWKIDVSSFFLIFYNGL